MESECWNPRSVELLIMRLTLLYYLRVRLVSTPGRRACGVVIRDAMRGKAESDGRLIAVSAARPITVASPASSVHAVVPAAATIRSHKLSLNLHARGRTNTVIFFVPNVSKYIGLIT